MTRRLSILALCIATSTTAQLSFGGFINGGFETGDFSGWTVGGITNGQGVALDGTPIPGLVSENLDFVNVRSGDYAAFASVAWGLDPREFLSLSQTVDLEPGIHKVGFFVGHDSPHSFGVGGAILTELMAIVVDGNRTPFTVTPPAQGSPDNIIVTTGTGPGNMLEFSSLVQSEGGPTEIELRISGSGIQRAGISVDDAFVERIPEPAAQLLTAIALIGISLIRRLR